MLASMLRWLLGAASLAAGALIGLISLLLGVHTLARGGGSSAGWIALALLAALAAFLVIEGRRLQKSSEQPLVAARIRRRPTVAVAIIVGLVIAAVMSAGDDDQTAQARPAARTSSTGTAPHQPAQLTTADVPTAAVEASARPSEAPVGIDEAQPEPALQSIPAALDPRTIYAALRSAGFEDGLGGRGWSRSRIDDMWCAVALLPHGFNEVSCLLESTHSDRIQLVELEAEFYDPAPDKQAMLGDLARAIAAVYPHASADLELAVMAEASWDGTDATLRVEPHPSGRGYDVRFTWRP